MKTMSKKGLAGRIIAIACLAAIAATSVGMSSLAKYRQSIGIAGTDGDDGSKSPRVAEFFFTAQVSKDGGAAFTTDELAEGVSLFSSAYSGATGLGTAKGTEGNTVEALNDDKVVAPGTHGGLEIKMEAGSAEDGKSHAEVDAIIKLDVKQLSGGEAASTVPIIYGLDTNGDGVDDKFYSSALVTIRSLLTVTLTTLLMIPQSITTPTETLSTRLTLLPARATKLSLLMRVQPLKVLRTLISIGTGLMSLQDRMQAML